MKPSPEILAERKHLADALRELARTWGNRGDPDLEDFADELADLVNPRLCDCGEPAKPCGHCSEHCDCDPKAAR